ncbi:MAG: response regulator, partial [Pseudomonadota bacterium]
MNAPDQTTPETASGMRLLIVDDDRPFLNRLGRAMEKRGFTVDLAESVTQGMAVVKSSPPDFAVVDMRLGDGNGLDVIQTIQERVTHCKSIILTGYGNIATAVTAVKLGAVDYLAKPAD